MSSFAEKQRRACGTLLLKNPDVRVSRLKHPTTFVPFTVERDGLGRIISNKHFVSTELENPSEKLPAQRRMSIFPSLQSEKAIRNGLDYAKIVQTSRNHVSSCEDENQPIPKLESVSRMFVKDKESIERKQMIKLLGQRRSKLLRNKSNEKVIFPAGFYDSKELSFKFKRAPQFEIKPPKTKANKTEDHPSQPKMRSQSLANIKKKNPVNEQDRSFIDLPQYTGPMSAQDALELQQAKRMEKLSIHIVDDFNQCHNLFKEKMKIAKMKAIQIKQRIDKL